MTRISAKTKTQNVFCNSSHYFWMYSPRELEGMRRNHLARPH